LRSAMSSHLTFTFMDTISSKNRKLRIKMK